jgi:hypothetical protein
MTILDLSIYYIGLDLFKMLNGRSVVDLNPAGFKIIWKLGS